MRVGLAQVNPTLGDFEGNAQKILEFARRADELRCDIVAFPELSLCGYPPEDLLFEADFIESSYSAFLKIVENSPPEIVVIVGFPERGRNGELYNSAGVIYQGRLVAVQRKFELPNYGVFDEKRYFRPGKEVHVFKKGDGIFGVSICEDIWVKGGITLEEVKKGARLLINISASPFHMGKLTMRIETLREKVRETNAWLAYVNMVGGQDELVFDGTSLFMSPSGKIVSPARRFEEDLIAYDIPEGEIRSDAPGAIDLGNARLKGEKTLVSREFKEQDEVEEVFSALVLGTRDFIYKNGFRKVVVGLSGGIDSSVTACVAVKALGKDGVIGISMPSRFTSHATRSDARKIAENLGIEFYEIPIEKAFSSYLDILKPVFKDLPPDVAEENLQARIRGTLLMAVANKFGYLVLNTGNKSEVAVGYCTLYGDMVGGFSVLKDVPKTLVYKIAGYINRTFDKPVIPESVIKRAPTAELRENQRDEDELMPYHVLDRIVHHYVEDRMKITEISKLLGVSQENVRRVVHMILKSEYKRRQGPPGVKITPRAFGKDWRYPITKKTDFIRFDN